MNFHFLLTYSLFSNIHVVCHWLNVDKAVGHDIISNRMLLAVKNEIAKPLSMLINRSLKEMFFPDQ
jgi:hypothetical protein